MDGWLKSQRVCEREGFFKGWRGLRIEGESNEMNIKVINTSYLVLKLYIFFCNY